MGIIRHRIKKDLIFFFIPWFTAFYLELYFFRNYGDSVKGIWGVIWEIIKQPLKLFPLLLHRIIGLPLLVIGLTIMIAAQIILWENYSGFVVIKKCHQLITHGGYRFSRNLIYLGAILIFASLPLYAVSVIAFGAILTTIPISFSNPHGGENAHRTLSRRV